MIKTLRITGLAAAILAVAFIVFPSVLGIRSDKEVEQFLNSAGVVEKFNKAMGRRSATQQSETSPLVKQAEAFALYLNPPAKPKAKRVASTRRPTITSRPTAVSAKFELIGTSFHTSEPELSLALINEPGTGMRWVRQNGEVGHLVIEQIKDGLIVVRDNKRTYELVPERDVQRSLIRGAPSGKTASEPTSALHKTDTRPVSNQPAFMDNEKNAALMGKLLRQFNDMQVDIESDQSDSEADRKEKADMVGKLISELRGTRIDVAEAKKIDHLGKTLNGAGAEGTRNRGRGDKIETGPRGPNSPGRQ